MNEFESLKTPKKKPKKKIKRYLKDVSFDFDGAHVAMTAGLGAASEMNDPFILKSIDEINKSISLTEEEINILKEIGEYDEDLYKSTDKTINAEADEKPNISSNDKEIKKEKMTDEKTVTMEEFLALKKKVEDTDKENRILISKSLIKDFKFSGDVEKNKEIEAGVAGILSTLDTEDREILVKAFEAVVKNIKADLDRDDVNKDKKEDGNPLKKMLDEEVGSEDGADKDELLKGASDDNSEPSFMDKYLAEINKDKKIKEDK